jgi:undecaprenyl diphosphate synthase
MSDISHIGMIMDGNRRWAKKNGSMIHQGHDRGAKVFGDTCDWCLDKNITYLTVYAFSTENWKRSQTEVVHIFKLLEKYFIQEKETCLKKGIKIKVIGERNHFDKNTLAIIEDIEEQTGNCNKLHAQIAFSYGGRDEIVRAVKRLLSDINITNQSVNKITEDVFSRYLDTAGIPDVDLVIRTGGAENRRLSNFMIWQTVYSELYFSDLLWPEFTKDEFERAISYYHSVKRKSGK